MTKKEEELILLMRSNPAFTQDFGTAIMLLERIGVIQFLRIRAHMRLYTGQTVESIAIAGAYSAGCSDTLDAIVDFKKNLIDVKEQAPIPVPNYGGTRAAILKGDLTRKEVEEHGKRK